MALLGEIWDMAVVKTGRLTRQLGEEQLEAWSLLLQPGPKTERCWGLQEWSWHLHCTCSLSGRLYWSRHSASWLPGSTAWSGYLVQIPRKIRVGLTAWGWRARNPAPEEADSHEGSHMGNGHLSPHRHTDLIIGHIWKADEGGPGAVGKDAD